jgi:hypothetical protein
MADKSPLADWQSTIKPDIVVQQLIVNFLNARIGQCVIPDCQNVIVRDIAFAHTCVFCSKACCLAKHMAFVDLEARYPEAFLEDTDYPSEEYACNACLAIIDAEYKQWLEKPQKFPSDLLYRKFWL